MGPILLMGGGLSAYACGSVWYYLSHRVNSVSATQAAPNLDFTVRLRCDRYYPSGGNELRDTYYYNVFTTPRPDMNPLGAMTHGGVVVAGTKIRTDDIGKPGSALKCKLYNLGDKIISSAQFRFTLQWQVDGATDPKDPRGADVGPVEYISPPLDMGNEENNRETYFYIVNTSDSVLYVVPSEIIEVKVAGSDTLIIAKLTSGNANHNRTLLLPGKRFINSPSASHPVPTPPASPIGK